LQSVANGLYKNEVILCAYDVSCYADKLKERFKDRVIVCTEKRLLVIHNYKSLREHIPLKSLHKVEIGYPSITEIVFITTQGKRISVQAPKSKKNSVFVQSFSRFLTEFEKPSV
jgi:hypothetical protein